MDKYRTDAGEWALGYSLPLLDLAAIRDVCDVRSRHAARTRAVPIDEIRGSEGRGEDFDADFRPLRPHSRDRWIRIAIAQQMGATMPPVELVQVGDAYFVRDGHHRISVARALGQREIDAQITVWEAARPRSREQCVGAGVLETELMHQAVSAQPKVSPSCVT